MSDQDQPEQVTSSHSVTERWRCWAMEKKYGWRLLRIKRTKDKTLKYDCIFEGETRFPGYMDDDTED